jgi:tagatose 1,6-diphosphate aldolase
MSKLSPGKIRGLQQTANSKGILTVCAIDHRDSLRQALDAQRPGKVSYRQVVDFKLDLVSVVAPLAGAVLLDPVYGAGQAIASGIFPGHSALLACVEKSGFAGDSTARITELLPDWNVRKIKKMGASGVKLLIYFRTDLKDIAAKQIALVEKVAGQCIDEDIPLLVEAVSYPTAAEKDDMAKFYAKKPELVIDAARVLTALPIDVLKSEFPGDLDYEKDEARLMDNCRKLNLASRLPWVLLSAGISFERFKKELEMVCKAGGSGFMAGRAIWQEATKIVSREDRQKYFESQTVKRLNELIAIADKWATPWYVKFGSKDGSFPELSEEWYKSY